jgi:hypothetical protein
VLNYELLISFTQVIKNILTAALLIIFGSLLAFTLGEVALRSYLVFLSSNKGSFEEELKRAESTSLEQLSSGTKLAGIVRPSQFSDLVYELKPKIQGTFLGKSLRTNSAGFRGEDLSIKKEAGTLRIVGIGDSVMFGWGVEEEESYLALLGRRVSAALNRKVEIINTGTPGYNTTMEVAALQHKAMIYEPDVIVLHVVNNDWGAPEFMTETDTGFSLYRCYLCEKVTALVRQVFHKVPTAQSEFFIGATPDHSDRVIKQYRYMLGPVGFQNALKLLHQLTAERKIPVFILFGGLPREIRETTARESSRYGFTLVAAKPYVDRYFSSITPPVSSDNRRLMLQLPDGDPHPSILGHMLYADAITDAVLKEIKVGNALQ